MTFASAIAAPVPTARSTAVVGASVPGDDLFGGLVAASTDADDAGVADAKVTGAKPRTAATDAPPARSRRLSSDDDRAADDAKTPDDTPPAGLPTGAALFVAPVTAVTLASQAPSPTPGAAISAPAVAKAVSTGDGTVQIPATATGPGPKAADIDGSQAFAAAVAEQTSQVGTAKAEAAAGVVQGAGQTAAAALATGLAKLLRPTPTVGPVGTSPADAKSGNGSAARTAQASGSYATLQDAAQAPAPPLPLSLAPPPVSASANPATAPDGTTDLAGTATQSAAAARITEGGAETSALPAGAAIATADSPPVGAPPAPPVTPTPSVTPGLAASLSSLSPATIETTAQIAAQITRQLNGKHTRFEMGLTPEGLGRVDVRLDIDADGQLTARLAFDNPLAATDLKGRADELRGQLQDAGFKLASDALDFSHRDPSSGGSGQGGSANPRQTRAFAAASRVGVDADTAPIAPWVSLSLTPRGVDMKV
ncbi:hypothetical protein BH10PSE2_BH10PSE2_04900 [soil metagenome]